MELNIEGITGGSPVGKGPSTSNQAPAQIRPSSTLNLDAIASGAQDLVIIRGAYADSPSLPLARFDSQDFMKQIEELRKAFDMPTIDSLYQLLSEELTLLFQPKENKQFFQKYLQLLTQFLPLGATYVEKLGNRQGFEKKLEGFQKFFKDLGDALGTLEKDSAVPKNLQEAFKEVQKFAYSVARGDISPKQFEGTSEKSIFPEQAMQTLNKTGMGKEIATFVKTALEAFSHVDKMPTFLKEAAAPLFVSHRMMAVLGRKDRMISPMVEEIASRFGKLIGSIAAPILPQVAKQPSYVGRVFEQAIFAGLAIGSILSNTHEGKLGRTDDLKSMTQIHFRTMQELKVIDQIPFSFMAFFVPFEDDAEDNREAFKAAKGLLMKLIRLLIKLVFVLMALVSGGSKIGPDGVEWMINENREILFEYLDEIQFSMRKVQEIYGANLEEPYANLTRAKDALSEMDLEVFWGQLFFITGKDRPLQEFLSEFEAADPFFKTLHKLYHSEEILPQVFRM